jgi:hypothetical protein
MRPIKTTRCSIRMARRIWPHLSRQALTKLKEIATQNHFSVGAGDLIYVNNGWYVTHTGLIRLASRRRCRGIEVQALPEFSDALNRRYAFKATVHKSGQGPGFVGYGDADPSNVSDVVRGAEMRVAETRAVNRALRKAYGIGICSVEEIGSFAERPQSQSERKLPPQPSNGNGIGTRTIRDRLCQVIRQHQLDPNLVKSYATEFCGVKTLREATREQVENFVTHLADWATKDRNALLCQLNSYPAKKEVVA